MFSFKLYGLSTARKIGLQDNYHNMRVQIKNCGKTEPDAPN